MFLQIEWRAVRRLLVQQEHWIKFDINSMLRFLKKSEVDRSKFIIECSGACRSLKIGKTNHTGSDIVNEHFPTLMSEFTVHRKAEYLYAYMHDRSVFELNPLLIIYAGSDIVRRARRRTNHCSSRLQNQCCRERFYVNFRELGWNDWIIAPHGYYANYCRGNCRTYPFNSKIKSNHGHVLSEYRKHERTNKLIQSCCTPIKFSSISVIYYEDNKKIVKRDVPSMAVDDCGCP